MVRLQPVAETRQQFGGISVMTDFRWRRDGLLPDVIKVNGRNFDIEDQIEKIQKAVIAGASKDQIREMVREMNASNIAGAKLAEAS